MKNKILLATLILAIYTSLEAQLEGRVGYRKILNLDSTKNTFDSIGTRAYLFFRPSQSFFVYNSEHINKNDFVLKIINEPNTYSLVTIDKYGESVFTDYSKNEITIREFVWKKPYITGEPIPAINWTIKSDTKYFGKIICHKATTNFRGRSYNAWFTYDIPLNLGPWKLHGLPGLILEASDSKNEVQFKFESIEIPCNEAICFKPPTQGKKVAFAEFKQLWLSETEKLNKFFQSSLEKGVTMDMKVRYFPIEKSYE